MPNLVINISGLYTKAVKQEKHLNGLFKQSTYRPVTTNALYKNAQKLELQTQSKTATMAHIDEQSRLIKAKTLDTKQQSIRFIFSSLVKNDKHKTAVYSTLKSDDKQQRSVYAYPLAKDKSTQLIWDKSISPNDETLKLIANDLAKVDRHKCLVWGETVGQSDFDWAPVDSTIPPPTTTVTTEFNPIQSVYFIMHTFSAVKLPERTPFEALSFNFSLDIDSFSWQLSMGIASKADLDIIRPDINGVKEIELNIDGHVFVFIIEDSDDKRAFNQSGYTVSGRSKTAYLSDPYKLPINFTETTVKTANQLITNELTNTGWTVSYNTVDWLVDANAFSYQGKSSMQAIMQVSGAVGAVILPHAELNQISINPRYPVSPWFWSGTVPKASLTEDVILSMSSKWRPQPDINSVYVTGANIGVNCFVKRTATAGDAQGVQVVDNLITHQDAGRERGRNIISNRGKQEIVAIDLPVFPFGQVPGIYMPGDLIEINEGLGNTWKAQSIGIAISGSVNQDGVVSVSQTLTLEKHYGNN